MIRESLWPWVAAMAVYVVLGVTLKSVVLNWIVGPLFPLLVLYLIPTALGLRRNRDSP